MTNVENGIGSPSEQDLFQVYIAETNKSLSRDQSPIQLGSTVELCFARFIELHKGTFEHCGRVGKYTNRFGVELGLTEDKRYALWLGSRLHDLGKIADVILIDNPEVFTDEQRIHFESLQHAQVGHELLQNMGFPEEISQIVRDHHVSHYTQASALTNVLRICDRFDYIVGGRPEAGIPPSTPEIAIARLGLQFGTQLDPQYEDLFRSLGRRRLL